MLLRERAASTSELAVALETPKGTVGHHLKVLESAGAHSRRPYAPVRALTERYYGRVARLFVMKGDESVPDELGWHARGDDAGTGCRRVHRGGARRTPRRSSTFD